MGIYIAKKFIHHRFSTQDWLSWLFQLRGWNGAEEHLHIIPIDSFDATEKFAGAGVILLAGNTEVVLWQRKICHER